MSQDQKVIAEQIVEDVSEETSSPLAAPQPKREQSAAEKKARKAMQKKGLEQVPGVTNISVLRKKSPMFTIHGPDVYKNATSDTWIVFGEARMDNFGRPSNSSYQRAMRTAPAAAAEAASAPAPVAAPEAEVEVAAKIEESADESGVDSKDIELVIAQANCTRAEAVKFLKNNNNDLISAIMEATS